MTTIRIYDLTHEYMTNPLGTDERHPRLSWKIAGDRRGLGQRAYQIQVATDEQFQQLSWDSGKVIAETSVLVPYEGQALISRQRYFYRVRIWDETGSETSWSETAYWETAMLSHDEWQASWIGMPELTASEQSGAEYLRKSFTLDGEIANARIYATSRGAYRLYVNGQEPDNSLFAPGWTSYRHRIQYQTYDVTDLLQADNAIGVVVANGWYKGNLGWVEGINLYGEDRSLLLELHVQYQDGRQAIVMSDDTWVGARGALQYSELYHGEHFDARLEPAGWQQPGFAAEDWLPVSVIEADKSVLVAQENHPVRITEEIRPIAVIHTPEGHTVLDLGQNMVGWMRFVWDAPAGAVLSLRHAEVLDRDGNFYIGNLRHALQTNRFTASGNGVQTFQPLLTFQGFRYVHVDGWTGSDDELLAAFVGCVIHTDMPLTGSFESSHDLLNQLQRNIVWGQRGNFLDVPTDCPQRDERLGWTGDAQVFIRTAAFNYQVAPFFTKWLRDLAADQLEDGGVPHVIPEVTVAGYNSSAWGDAAVICPWTIYECYGDTRILERQYPSMKGWVEYIRAQGEQEFLWNTGFHFGDWLGLDAKENSYIGATPRDLIASAFYAYSTSLLAKSAAILGYEDEAKTYTQLHQSVVQAFRQEFVTPNGRVASPTQTAYCLALMFDLLTPEDSVRTASMLAAHVEENGIHLTTGFVGTPYLCLVLTQYGYTDLAYKLALQEEYPSWLYSVKQGATTIWEHWDGIKEDGSFWSDAMNSYNHYAYGAIGDWLYRRVAGIDTTPDVPGYRRIHIQPHIGEELQHASAQLETMYGQIASAWRKDEQDLHISLTIPANTQATVVLPVTASQRVQEQDIALEQVTGVSECQFTDTQASFVLQPGSYQFLISSPA